MLMKMLVGIRIFERRGASGEARTSYSENSLQSLQDNAIWRYTPDSDVFCYNNAIITALRGYPHTSMAERYWKAVGGYCSLTWCKSRRTKFTTCG
uniref:Uncharacterized protein n=1 Tax=Ascaris lumbricoides TaxID=6252 RepID=A0A0M3HFP1_ASCLU